MRIAGEQPTAKSRVIRRLHKGLEVKALEKIDKYWWKVQVDGKTGYAKAFLLEAAE
ncbi:SH3 domain-containing protein [Phaeodactylibacter luteus]|uniref:SH3 domain-containing protein n=1 Tax=Phaeodactylibacter luteus TaxID=1564516 RepID=A0A5C6RFZ1_9BACT|nr:SH3 domain-containing protein [Phaeodactylibacter luteus]